MALSVLFQIYYASSRIPALRDNAQLMIISFDPERDGPDQIKEFTEPVRMDKNRDQRLSLQAYTTQNKITLQPLLDGFGQVVDRSEESGQINHLLRMYLIDREGQIRNVYGLGFMDPRLLVGDVETLLLEDGTL